MKRTILNWTLAASCVVLLAGCKSTPLAPVESTQLSLQDADRLTQEAEQAITATDYPTAVSALEKVTTAYPTRSQAWYRLGTAYLHLQLPDKAQYALEQSLRADPKLQKAYANLALAHAMQLRYAAEQALSSDQVSDSNKIILRSLMRDVDHALNPPSNLPPTIKQ